MFIIIVIVTSVLCTVYFISLCPNRLSYRVNLIQFLRRIDLVDRGQFWLGGLVSCGILALIIFAGIFSIQYIQQYPIEQMKSSSMLSLIHI